MEESPKDSRRGVLNKLRSQKSVFRLLKQDTQRKIRERQLESIVEDLDPTAAGQLPSPIKSMTGKNSLSLQGLVRITGLNQII